MNNFPLLNVIKINKKYKDGKIYRKILNDINISIEYGEMIAIIGSSGSGKSTLLHLLGGLDEPTSGDIIFENKSFRKLSLIKRALVRNNRIGFIYQFHHLLPDFNVLENVAMPLMINGATFNLAKRKAKEMLINVGMENKINFQLTNLSGGERQRIAIARALMNNPVLVLADEPTGNLDQHNSNVVFNLMQQINKDYGTTFIIATHDLFLAKKLNKQLEIYNGYLNIKNNN